MTKKESSTGPKKKIRPENPTFIDESGDFFIETFGVDRPSIFEIALEGDETVRLENTSNGLVLVDPDPNFLSDPQSSNVEVTTDFGQGIYDVGRMKSRETEVAFGFNKTIKANSPSQNFSFRPQRVWAQLIDRKSEMSTNLFLPTYDPGRFPIARFKLPLELLDDSDSVDVRLWVVPNVRDNWPPINDPMSKNQIPPGARDIVGIKCELRESEGAGEFTVTISPGDDPRGYFVNCPAFESFRRKTIYQDRKRKQDIFEFKVSPREANFSLSVLSLEQYQGIINRVEEDPERVGKDTDPIFGDNAIWIKFQNVTIK